MDQKAARFLAKTNIQPTDVLYILHSNRRTTFYLTDGSVRETYLPLKHLLNALPRGNFLNINKGTVIAVAAIDKIENDQYTMRDGRVFRGRRRAAGEHKLNRRRLNDRSLPEYHLVDETVRERFSNMDRCPLPIAVVEMIYNLSGQPVDYVFRYCNEALAKLEGRTVDGILDRSFRELFDRDGRKWIKSFDEVARGMGEQVIRDLNPYTNKPTCFHCFCPLPGYCACVITADE